jgi:hypothetical protein
LLVNRGFNRSTVPFSPFSLNLFTTAPNPRRYSFWIIFHAQLSGRPMRCGLLFPDPPALYFYFPFVGVVNKKKARFSQKSDANRLIVIAIFNISTYDEKRDLLLLLILQFAIPSRRQA